MEFRNRAGGTPAEIALASGAWGAALPRSCRERFGRQAGIRIWVEHLPERTNAVRLATNLIDGLGCPAPHVTYHVGAHEHATIAHAGTVVRKIFAAMGARDVRRSPIMNGGIPDGHPSHGASIRGRASSIPTSVRTTCRISTSSAAGASSPARSAADAHARGAGGADGGRDRRDVAMTRAAPFRAARRAPGVAEELSAFPARASLGSRPSAPSRRLHGGSFAWRARPVVSLVARRASTAAGFGVVTDLRGDALGYWTGLLFEGRTGVEGARDRASAGASHPADRRRSRPHAPPSCVRQRARRAGWLTLPSWLDTGIPDRRLTGGDAGRAAPGTALAAERPAPHPSRRLRSDDRARRGGGP
jgi:hypothetical protein